MSNKFQDKMKGLLRGADSGESISGLLAKDPTPTNPSVGEEFVEWAEKYWGLKHKYEPKEKEEGESCPYSYVKGVFSNKIDEILRKRLSL